MRTTYHDTPMESYAVCWLPQADGALAHLSRELTGWCPDLRMSYDHSADAFLPDSNALFCNIRRFGLIGMIRRPFVLRDGSNALEIESALNRVAETMPGFDTPPFELAWTGSYLALAPNASCGALQALSRRVGTKTDPFDANGRQRSSKGWRPVVHDGGMRSPGGLRTVDADDFHVPLTDPISREKAVNIAPHLRKAMHQVGLRGGRVDEIVLIGDPGGGRRAQVLHAAALGESDDDEPRGDDGPGSDHPFAPRIVQL
ncbi:MAG: DUF1045 domain-containing protein [Pseudomonadota bacterium]